MYKKKTDFKSQLLQRYQIQIVSIATFFFSLSIYCFTLYPEVDVADSAELSLQSYQLGVTHPPGYPVHTILGYILVFFFDDPAIATNLLSALCTSGSIGIMSLFIFHLTGNKYSAFFVPAMFSLTPRIWGMGITTEVYNINLLILSTSIFCIYRWTKNYSNKALFLSAALYGISFGSYLANALLFPAFSYLILKKTKFRFKTVFLFSVVVTIFSSLLLMYSYFRAKSLPPIGTLYLPTSTGDAIKYFSGQQYGTTELFDFSFYTNRIFQHMNIFSKNYLYLVSFFGLGGIYILWKRSKNLTIFFLLVLGINLGYFTFYKPGDYYMMVNPSHYVFTLFIAICFDRFYKRNVYFKNVSLVIILLTSFILLVYQFPKRYKRSTSYPVTSFSVESLQKFPPNSIVICDWYKLTPLLFFQKTKGLRNDCLIIQRVKESRYYDNVEVESYITAIESQITSRPIIIDSVEAEVLKKYEIYELDSLWYRIEPSK